MAISLHQITIVVVFVLAFCHVCDAAVRVGLCDRNQPLLLRFHDIESGIPNRSHLQLTDTPVENAFIFQGAMGAKNEIGVRWYGGGLTSFIQILDISNLDNPKHKNGTQICEVPFLEGMTFFLGGQVYYQVHDARHPVDNAPVSRVNMSSCEIVSVDDSAPPLGMQTNNPGIQVAQVPGTSGQIVGDNDVYDLLNRKLIHSLYNGPDVIGWEWTSDDQYIYNREPPPVMSQMVNTQVVQRVKLNVTATGSSHTADIATAHFGELHDGVVDLDFTHLIDGSATIIAMSDSMGTVRLPFGVSNFTHGIKLSNASYPNLRCPNVHDMYDERVYRLPGASFPADPKPGPSPSDPTHSKHDHAGVIAGTVVASVAVVAAAVALVLYRRRHRQPTELGRPLTRVMEPSAAPVDSML